MRNMFLFLGIPGADADVPKLSFSAALTIPMDRAGTIIFDKVFVNKGGFYDSRTGESPQLSVHWSIIPLFL